MVERKIRKVPRRKVGQKGSELIWDWSLISLLSIRCISVLPTTIERWCQLRPIWPVSFLLQMERNSINLLDGNQFPCILYRGISMWWVGREEGVRRKRRGMEGVIAAIVRRDSLSDSRERSRCNIRWIAQSETSWEGIWRITQVRRGKGG